MALTLRYFTEFGKPVFQLITASSSNERIDQKSAFMTHRAERLVYVTKFTIRWWSEFWRYLLLIYRLSFALPLLSCCDAWLPVYSRHCYRPVSVAEFMLESIVLCSTCTMSS